MQAMDFLGTGAVDAALVKAVQLLGYLQPVLGVIGGLAVGAAIVDIIRRLAR